MRRLALVLRAALPALALALLAAVPALADGNVSDSVSAGSGPYLENALEVSFSATPRLDLDLGYQIATDQAFVAHHAFTAGATFAATDALSVDVDLEVAPTVTTDQTLVDRRGGGNRVVDHYALGTEGASAALGYTVRTDAARLLVEPAFGVVRFSAAQTQTRRGQVVSYTGGAFDQFSPALTLGADVGHTALRLSGAVYLYDEDPASIAALRLPQGAGGSGGQGGSLGSPDQGLPSRPESYELSASVRQRWDRWRAKLSAGYGSYLHGQGSLVVLGTRLSRELTSTLTATGGLALQLDQPGTDAGDAPGSAGTNVYLVGTFGLDLDF